MSDVMLVDYRLKIFSDDNTIIETDLKNVPNVFFVNTPELADIIISDNIYELDYNTVSLKDFWNDGHIFWSIPNKCSRFDQETIMTFIKGRMVRYDNATVSPCHQFIDNNEFKIFKEINSNKTFQLLELDGPYEKILSIGTLDELIESYNNYFTQTLSSVIYSKDKKYFVRLDNPSINVGYKKVHGFLCTDDRGKIEIACDVELDHRVKPLLYLIFTRFSGAFTIEYYVNVNKIQIYSFKTGLTKNHINDSILNIDIVQNTIKRMSTRYNFVRNINE
jgi:hypothetical protein